MIAAIVGAFWAIILLQILLCKCTPYPQQDDVLPPEQRHDVLTGDQGDECMEGSFD